MGIWHYHVACRVKSKVKLLKRTGQRCDPDAQPHTHRHRCTNARIRDRISKSEHEFFYICAIFIIIICYLLPSKYLSLEWWCGFEESGKRTRTNTHTRIHIYFNFYYRQSKYKWRKIGVVANEERERASGPAIYFHDRTWYHSEINFGICNILVVFKRSTNHRN